ncbi:MAG: response regulator [Halioglobus sp.]
MYTDNDCFEAGVDGVGDPTDEAQEKSLRWLLEMDLSEPEEKLFTVSGNEYCDQGLSAYEAEVAGRPLVRGNTASDDLASYIDEEIVISSESQCSDIYTDVPDEEFDDLDETLAGEAMAVDYSHREPGVGVDTMSVVSDGTDILGLIEDDDIGEKFLTIKRVKPETVAQVVETVAIAPVPPVAIESSTPVTPIMEQPQSDNYEAVVVQSSAEHDMEDVQDRTPLLDNFPVEELRQASEDLQWSVDVSLLEEVEPELNTPAEIHLSEAPVPCLVAEPGAYQVANEEGSLTNDACSDDTAPATVDAYLANMQTSADDDEFDRFLLGGEHLPGSETSLDELAVARTEGIVSVDPSADIEIDYHEDFRTMEGFDYGSVSAITSVISLVMEEISCRARNRIEELGFATDAIEVDVMLGNDPQSIKRCYAEGFEPVIAICSELPEAFQGLAKAEQSAIYVRLFHGQTNENWNDLFSADFVAAPQSASDEAENGPDSGLALEPIELAAEACVEEVGFTADVLDSQFDDDFLVNSTVSAEDDIEAIFDDFNDAVAVQETEEVQEYLSANSGAAFASVLSEQAGQTEVSSASAGFDEAIFAADIFGELAEVNDADATDIDAAFSAVTQSQNNVDAICGVDVDEFATPDEFQQTGASEGTDEVPSAASPGQESPDTAWFIPQGISFSHAGQGSAEIFTDFLDAFIEEGSAEVEKLEDAFGEWEKDPTIEAAFAPVARTLHTVKGIAKGVGLQRYGTLVHNFETLLEARPRPESGARQDYFRMMNVWLDAVVRGIEFVQENRSDIASEFPVCGGLSAEADESLAAVGELPGSEESAEASLITPPIAQNKAALARQKKRDQQLADDGAKALAAQQSVRITSEKLDLLLNLTNQAQQLGVRSAQSTTRSKRAAAELQGRLTSVRSHIAKIADRALLNVNVSAGSGRSTPDMDALEMDQYSELQEAANILREGVEDLADLVELASRQNAHVEALLKQQSSVISSITSSIQAARVVPVSRLMPGLRRIVRTVSSDLNKAVSFKVLNEVGALDRDYYARCQVILEHMVRNALDHGIEPAEERLALGKPTAGRITIDVRKSGGDYIIKLADDGRGIDPEAIRESAYEKGLDIDVDALSDEEAMRLIFHKGFSTANTLSEISGRGVGMDIVMSELQQLGGDIQIQSAVGLGTSFEVRIPSNVSVNGALFVTAGESSYAVPLNGLVAVEHIAVDDFYNAVAAGETLPLFDMDCEPAYLATLCQGVGLPDRSVWGKTIPVIIAGSDQRYMAIAIDNVEEALELVVRSLGAQFSSVPGVAGAATTADGEAIVALDLNLLVGSVVSGNLAPVAVSRDTTSTLLALVVDDSRTQRMVATSQLDTVGVETITAENGMVAIDLLNATHRLPDIVLLDVEMPVKDGIETLREIRKSQRYGHLPVIMVTSRTGPKHRALARDAGCNGYMGKPFNFPGLVEQISELTGHKLQLS